MAKKLKYGLIGCGGCGTGKHLPAYDLFRDEIDLYATCDIVPEKAKAAAAKYGISRTFTDYREMLADPKLDVVSIAVPNALHMPIAVAALQAGKHVHLEKPIALNAEEAQAIVDAKDASGKKLMVGLNNRFTEMAMYAKRYVDEGNMGEIYHARCGWRRRRGIPGKGGWFTTKALSGGGPMIDLGVHFFDLTMFLMGFPEPASVSAATYCKFGNLPSDTNAMPEGTNNPGKADGTFDVEDFAVGFVKLETGASVAFEFSWASNIERETTYFELLGTKGGMSLYHGELKIFSEVAGKTVNIVPNMSNRKRGWGEVETRHFIDCIRTNKEPMAPPEQAVRMMRIIDGIYASAESGREVVVSPVIA